MGCRLLGVAMAALVANACVSAAVLEVTTKADSGPGSLRQAIIDSNQNGESDTIQFASGLAGGVFRPRDPLPPLTEGGTRIVGDVDGDRDPDIILDGSESAQAWTSGIRIQSDDNVISKLVIKGFTIAQVLIDGGLRNTVRGCRISVNPAGTAFAQGGDGVWIVRGGRNRIGAPGAGGNLILGRNCCVGILNSFGNSVANNLIGTDITGTAALVASGAGVAILSEPLPCRHNTIGGADSRLRNVIAGPATPVLISGRAAHHNSVLGNYISLKADGTGPITDSRLLSVRLGDGAYANTIGGERSNGGNAIFGSIMIGGSGTADNRLLGNFIGLNAQGEGSFRGPRGITIEEGAGQQTIGGVAPEEGNVICGGAHATAIEFFVGGGGSTVQNNVIGADAHGEPSGFADTGVAVYYTAVTIRGNVFRGLQARGIYVHEGSPNIAENTFARNPAAVVVGELGTPVLGNVSNSGGWDDGENVFLSNNDWYIFSYSRGNVRAENNNFSTASPTQINAKIWDRRDDPVLGWVDFRPFIVPPAAARARSLQLTSLAAVPTSRGAEVAFSLSQPATVTCLVRNIAGRPIRTLESGAVRGEGSNVLLWDGQADGGCAVPAGQYVVELLARSDDGQQARRVTTFRLHR